MFVGFTIPIALFASLSSHSAAFEPSSPIEEVTTALREKSLKFMLTHDVNIQMPEIMFDGAIFRIEPRAIEGNGMLAKLEFVPRTELAEARGHGTPRILFKKISKSFIETMLLSPTVITFLLKFTFLSLQRNSSKTNCCSHF